ncbi:hypothetical protein B484DRAFT_399215 [Ochromonadaceae sp. CCMP2298]|nr:hypothetical protein B484DRAFT_399215 [Ochromonadaceae sp. CCMP2298]
MASSVNSSLNSSIESINAMKLELPGGLGALGAMGGGAGGKNINFLSQLEGMMSAVKKEAGALESMKLKLKDMEELKSRLGDMKTRLGTSDKENAELRRMVREADEQNLEIRSDMQRLNDIYHSERSKLLEAQQVGARQEQELSGVKREREFFSAEAGKVPDLKSQVKASRAQLSALKKIQEEERGALEVGTASRGV